MFFKCKGLKLLDLKSFNTKNVTDMSYMFNWCTSLTSIDLSSFKADKTNTEDMFYGCKNLTNFSCLDEILNTKSINEKIKKIMSVYDIMTLENANIVE